VVPPLVGAAVKVTEVPVHIEVALAEILTDGTAEGFTVMVIPVEVAVVGLTQAKLLVKIQVTICPLVSVELVNVELLVPAFVPSTNH